MCLINIVNKKILDFQSIFLFLLLNFISVATALNIPFFDSNALFISFFFNCSKKDPFSHSTVWSFILSPDNLKHVLGHNQFVVFIKYKSSACQQKDTKTAREQNSMTKYRKGT